MSDDRVRLFLFEQLPLRGHWVRLGAAWRELLKHPDYSPPVRALLGEATAAAVLLASTLKFEGTLTLQLEGDGAVRLLVAQCTHDFRLRSVARVDATRPVTDFRSLVGQGRVVVTVEAE